MTLIVLGKERKCDRCGNTLELSASSDSSELPNGWAAITTYHFNPDPCPLSTTELCPRCAADFARWWKDTGAITL